MSSDPVQEFFDGVKSTWEKFIDDVKVIVTEAAAPKKEESEFTDEQWLELAVHELKTENEALRNGYRELADEFETRERLAAAKQEEVPAYLGTRAAAYRTARLIVLDKLDQLTNFPSTGVQDGDDAV